MTVPREFVFMDRAAIGLGGVFIHLRAELNFYRLFNETIEQFDIEDVRSRQTAALNAAGVCRCRRGSHKRGKAQHVADTRACPLKAFAILIF